MPTFNFDTELPIFKIAHNGDLNALQALIRENPELASKCASNCSSLLHFAAEAGHLHVVRWLLSRGGSKISETTHYGNTALLLAARNGHLETVQWLLSKGGSNISETNQYGNTSLLRAAFYGQLETVQWLLSEGGSNISETNKKGSTALLLAASNGHLKTVQWLLSEDRSNISGTNQYGDTALLLAADYGHLETVRHLINHPAMTYRQLKSVVSQISRDIDHMVRSLIDKKIKAYEQLIEEAASDEVIQGSFKVTEHKIIIANELFCPISLELIEDPVIAHDGHLYNSKHITKWLKQTSKAGLPIKSPKTGLRLKSEELYPALHIKKVLTDIHKAIEALYQKRQADKKRLLTSPKALLQRAMCDTNLSHFFKEVGDSLSPQIDISTHATQATQTVPLEKRLGYF